MHHKHPPLNLAAQGHGRLAALGPALLITCRKAITAAGKLGTFDSGVQFPPSNSTLGGLPEVANLVVPDTAAVSTAPAVAALSPANSTADSAAAGGLNSPLAAGNSTEAGGNVPLLLGDGQPLAAEGQVPVTPPGGNPTALTPDTACNVTIMALLSHDRAFSMLTNLIQTAGGHLSGHVMCGTCAIDSVASVFIDPDQCPAQAHPRS